MVNTKSELQRLTSRN